MSNAVVHFDIGGGGALAEFYSGLFGWDPRPVADGRWALDTRAGAGIGGDLRRAATPSAALCVECADPAATLERAAACGGRIVEPVTEDATGARALFADPDGQLIALAGARRWAQPSDGDGGAVTWFEILGSDSARTLRFYAGVFGWPLDAPAHPDYAVVNPSPGRGIWGGVGGGVASPWAIIYVAVEDVEKAVARARELGGAAVAAPDAAALKNAARAALYGSAEDMSVGWIRDPAGNRIGLAHKARG